MSARGFLDWGGIRLRVEVVGCDHIQGVEALVRAQLRAENARLHATVVEQAIELVALRGKIDLELSGPVPQRVPGDVKDKLVAIIDKCVAAGWSMERACTLLEVDRRAGVALAVPP